MGSAICRVLSAAGHEVWGLDREIAPMEGVRLIAADVTQRPALEAAFAQIREEAGSLDGFIHTAGIYDLNALAEMPEEDFLRDFDVNVFGVFRVNQVFLPLLSPGGRIVIITSELAPLSPLPFTGVYGITKSALERYAESLRMELQLLDHPVIVLRPGAVDTGMLAVSTEKLARFCETTRLYAPGAERFRKIVDSVESRSVAPEVIGRTVLRALTDRRPRLTYNVNRNPALRLLNMLPARLRLWIIRRILTA